MKIFSKLKVVVPFFILILLIVLLGRELFYGKTTEIPSSLIGESLPAFKLPNLEEPSSFLSSDELKGHVTLLNVWATWCYACAVEHPTLVKIAKQYHIPIYSIDYKDEPQLAKAWLKKHGNPFIKVGMDPHGEAVIDLGVYGTPETFVLNKEGKIVYRHIGVIDTKTWNDILYPLIEKYQEQM